MIEATHAVVLHDRRIGSIFQRGDVARFVFADGYWDDPNREVLGLWFEDDPRRSPSAALRLPPWFSNLLPEGPLRDWIARDQGVSVDRELQLLLRIGRDLPGAVQVIPAEADEAFDPELLENPQLGWARSAAPQTQWRFSLAGVSLKFSLLKQNDRLTLPAAGTLGDWIVKLPDARHRDVPANEFAAMKLAHSIGIDTPDVNLIHRDELSALPANVWPNTEELAYAISRFDRGTAGERIHIEDLAQVRGFYDSEKYDGSFETVAALAYRNRDKPALREFVRRLTFNVLIGNGDAHLKNWSLIYRDRRIPTLSPAYDLASTGPYASAEAPDDFGLKFGGVRELERVGRDAFRQLQRRLGVDSTDVLDVVDETLTRFEAAWSSGAGDQFPAFVRQWIEQRLPSTMNRLSCSLRPSR